MRKRTPISTIMSTNLVTLNIKDDLVTAEKLFLEKKIKHIPVVNNKEIIGMLSYSDILRISYADSTDDEKGVDTFVYNTFTIEQVMVKNIIMVPPYATIKETAELLTKKDFHALPVVEDRELVGIVTTRDLLKYLIEQL
ncbi:CBS domain-containing protein [uncultured Polaribacter sp.]|uniref:CBS domain-containing protein n=1 Tax=uncultured Polaribacter sp. TaxID=174711 RepID=UPI002605DAD6|nr:CBS domain-containing protein [uncultured Polaribacter sp.]